MSIVSVTGLEREGARREVKRSRRIFRKSERRDEDFEPEAS